VIINFFLVEEEGPSNKIEFFVFTDKNSANKFDEKNTQLRLK
jgi:hypothetical protein